MGETNAFTEMLGTLDFTVLSDNFVAVIKTVAPVAIGIVAISKGYRWLRGMLYSA